MYYVGVRVRSQGQGWLRGFALVGEMGRVCKMQIRHCWAAARYGLPIPFIPVSLYEYISLRFWYLKPGLLPKKQVVCENGLSPDLSRSRGSLIDFTGCLHTYQVLKARLLLQLQARHPGGERGGLDVGGGDPHAEDGAEAGGAGPEAQQDEGLLQDPRRVARLLECGDQEGVPQAESDAPSG